MKSYLCIPDLHIPYHDLSYLKIISKVISIIKPDGIVQLGDAVDCFQISKYPKDPQRKNTVFDDVEEWCSVLNEWARLLKRGEIHLLEGNHEERLKRFIWSKAPELDRMVKTFPELLGLKARNSVGGIKFHWHPLSDWRSCEIGNCILIHGVLYSKHLAVGNLDRYPRSIIQGHSHRFQYASNGDRFSCSLGHGSDEGLTAHSPVPTGWQQAFGILYTDDNRTWFDPFLVNNNRTCLYGEIIEAKVTKNTR